MDEIIHIQKDHKECMAATEKRVKKPPEKGGRVSGKKVEV
jgi:hypothetical protein